MRLLLLVAIVVRFTAVSLAEVPLPGTQPLENGVEFGKVDQCKLCHADTKNGPADPHFSWAGSMMSQAARDPVFRAAMTIANQEIPGVGEYCLRCHAPHGWLDGRSKDATGASLTREDLHGVSCDFCHHMVDPRSDEGKALVKQPVPGFGNAMYVVAGDNTARGPYGDGEGAMPHQVAKSAFHGSSELCGTCHDISNPLQAADAATQPPYAYGMIERTYSEWLLSDFAKEGAKGTCQACHMPTVAGGGFPARYSPKHREHFVDHITLGGSTWVQDVTLRLWESRDMSRPALDAAKQRNAEFLKTSAELATSFPQPGQLRVRITNLTGHKLPTGYDEGRRMWLNIAYLDSTGSVIGEIGRYGPRTDPLSTGPVEVSTLLDPESTRVYECLRGLSPAAAAKYGKPEGKSFHFVLSDIVVKDNRIPPRGFVNEAFARHLAAPVGARYADGQHWDEFEAPVPPAAAKVRVRLMFQSTSWEYIRFLLEENRTDDWGKRLYDAWQKTGRCPPQTIAEQTTDVPR